MTTTAHHVLTPTATSRTDQRHTLPMALVVALITLAALTLVLAVWQLVATSNTNAPPSQAAVDELAPYRPGGSVYQQQVPKAAIDELAPYRPGGSVYQQQVPQAAD